MHPCELRHAVCPRGATDLWITHLGFLRAAASAGCRKPLSQQIARKQSWVLTGVWFCLCPSIRKEAGLDLLSLRLPCVQWTPPRPGACWQQTCPALQPWLDPKFTAKGSTPGGKRAGEPGDAESTAEGTARGLIDG